MKPLLSIIFIGFLLLTNLGKMAGQVDSALIVVPGVAAVALQKGEAEFNFFNSLGLKRPLYQYQSAPFGNTGREGMYFGSILQFTYGLSPGRNLNLGLDLSYNLLTNDQFDLNPDSTGTSLLLGPRVRWRPFGSLGRTSDLTLQHYAWFVVSDPGKAFRNKGQPYWGNEIIFTQFVNNRRGFAEWVFVIQGGFNLLPKSTMDEFDQINAFSIPLALLVGIYPNRRFMVYALGQWVAEYGSVPWDASSTRYRRRAYFAAGPGVQYSVNNNFFLNASYAHSLYEQGDVSAQSISLGIRWAIPPR